MLLKEEEEEEEEEEDVDANLLHTLCIHKIKSKSENEYY